MPAKLSEKEILEGYQLLINNIENYAIFLLDPEGNILTWNKGAEKLKGYKAKEIIGQSFTIFYPTEAIKKNEPQRLLKRAKKEGKAQAEGFRVRKNGSKFWANVTITALYNKNGKFKGFAKITHDLSLHKKLETALGMQATHDPLTLLANRHLLMDRLDQAIARAKREDSKIIIIYIDLDNFKMINDIFGHRTGDEVLKIMGQRFSLLLRKSDTVARIGGDEFVLVLSNQKHLKSLYSLLWRILEEIELPINVNGHNFSTTVTMGITVPNDGDNAEILIQHADIAMYQAKKIGKNTFQFFKKEMDFEMKERLSFEHGLRKALKNGDFFLEYQPKVDINNDKIIGVEALIRWRKSKNEIVYPNDFLSIAEETGLIMPIGEWVLKTACEQSLIWQKAGMKPFSISVNVSPIQFANHNFPKSVKTNFR